MISVLLDRNIFIKNLLTAKSNDFKSLFVSAKHSTPYISIGIHFDLVNFRMTSLDVFLSILLKIVLSERKTSCRTETETVSRMEKAGSISCCCSHQSVASPSLCLCQAWLTVNILSTFLWCSHGSMHVLS